MTFLGVPFPACSPGRPPRVKGLGSRGWLVYWAISRISRLACSLLWWVIKGLVILSSDRTNPNTIAWCRPLTSLKGCGLQKAWSVAGLPTAMSQLTSFQSPLLFQTPTEQTLIQLLSYARVENSSEETPRE